MPVLILDDNSIRKANSRTTRTESLRTDSKDNALRESIFEATRDRFLSTASIEADCAQPTFHDQHGPAYRCQ